MKYLLSILSIVFVCVFVCGNTACNKPSIVTPTDTSTLFLDLHTFIDSNEVGSPGHLYPDTNGRAIALNVAQFYISNISITNTSGRIFTFPGTYLLKTLGTNTFLAGTIQAGNYASIAFNVGIDPATNDATIPSNYTSPNPLAPQNPSMWFGSMTEGYIFMKITGSARDNASTPAVPISYQIGSDQLYETVVLPTHNPAYTVGIKQSLTVHIICDYGKLLRTVNNFASNPTTDTYLTNPNLANTIAVGIPNMFYYKN